MCLFVFYMLDYFSLVNPFVLPCSAEYMYPGAKAFYSMLTDIPVY